MAKQITDPKFAETAVYFFNSANSCERKALAAYREYEETQDPYWAESAEEWHEMAREARAEAKSFTEYAYETE